VPLLLGVVSAGAASNPREHSRSEILTVVEGKHVVGVARLDRTARNLLNPAFLG
jgi:hypothetical protein